jgi:hypothetical protein
MAGDTMSDIQGYSDEELKEPRPLRGGRAQESLRRGILRRRREASWKAWAQKHPFLAPIVTSVGLVTLMQWCWR